LNSLFSIIISKLDTFMYRSGNDRPQHAQFDFDPINIYHKTMSFSHGLSWRAKHSRRIWAK